MALKIGGLSSIGMGQETTWGTAVTPTDFVEFTSESLKMDINRIAVEAINGTASLKKHVDLQKEVKGDIAFPVNADDCIGMLLKVFFGQSATSQQQGTYIAYLHTFKGNNRYITDGVKGSGLTLQVVRDSIGFDYSGCLPSVLKFDVAQNGLLNCTASMIGKIAAIQGTPTSATFTTQNPLVFSSCVVNKTGSPIEVVSASVVIDNGVVSSNLLGQTTVKRPEIGGRKVTGNLLINFEDSIVYNDFINGTNYEITLTATGAVITGAYSYYLKFTLGNVVFLNNPTPNVGNKGVITQNVPFMALYDDATDQDIKVELMNTISGYDI
jgi:hypothetical protein